MNILNSPITWPSRGRPLDGASAESCFGVGCPLRGSCNRYRAVERVAGCSTSRASCIRGRDYPGYVTVTPELRQDKA
jgi:hypothetical protein